VRPTGVAALIAVALAASACGSHTKLAADPAHPIPTPIGAGPRFLPGAASEALGGVRAGLRCEPGALTGDAAHLELFAEGKVVLIPEGIGVAPPLRHGPQRLLGGRCRYPVTTVDRLGIVHFTCGGLTLGDLFTVWGRPLESEALLSWRAQPGTHVRAFVDGDEWNGDVRRVPLSHHAEIVVEINGFVPPHGSYLFPR
jgi:hypothetical protein